MAQDDRQTKQARLTPASHAAWERLLTRRGVTFTALAEALGELLAETDDWVPDSAIVRARELDRQRHSRQKDR